MEQVFKIREYDMIGKKVYAYVDLGFIKKEYIEKKNGIIVKAGSHKENKNFGITLSNNLKGVDAEKNLFLPYFADVTEDVPAYYKFKPKVFKNCQLMIETRGNYNFFYHKKTDTKLLIAINSNFYQPIKTN